MGRKRKRPSEATSSSSFSAWRKVDVGLLAPSKAAAGAVKEQDDENYESAVNHYDTPKLVKAADRDLEADPQEGMGIFFGLEVLSGDDYQVVQVDGQKKLVVKESNDEVEKEPQEESSDAKQKKKKRKKKDKTKYDEEGEAVEAESNERASGKAAEAVSDALVDNDEDPESSRSKKKRKKKKNKNKKKPTEDDLEETSKDDDREESSSGTEVDPAAVTALQTSWMTATGGVTLHETLCRALLQRSFWTPTPIQAATLPASILGRRNIVGAAPTGSGKTLAYLLPVLEHLLQQNSTGDNNNNNSVQSLILVPTRELAMQVHGECNKLVAGKCVTLVGGLASQKQERVLKTKRPPIVIATPGRLWDMISSRNYEHLNDLSQIRFLVIDEADRMVQQGSFPQLHSILDAVQRANPMDDSDDEEEVDDDMLDDSNPGRMLGLPGVPGEAKLRMLNDDILAQIQKQKDEEEGVVQEIDDDEFQELEHEMPDDLDDEDEISLPARPPVVRQTFVYSATLTLPPSASYIPQQNKRKFRHLKGLDGAIEEILVKARAKGQTKIVDLSNDKKQAKFNEKILEEKEKSKAAKKKVASTTANNFNLPPGLTLQEIKCTQLHKDSHLYAYLLTTRPGASGPCLVFCNSIAAVRRVCSTLQTLGLPARMLHAHMQQRSRFKSIESLQNLDSRAIVVATDVAARGLDIQEVSCVVHYDAARSVGDFVHRAGRTARGMGEHAVGTSLSLVSPGEDKAHRKTSRSLNASFEYVQMDGRLLTSAQERANLASKIVIAEESEKKTQKNNQWFKDAAEDAGLEVDDNMLDDGLAGGDEKQRQQLLECRKSKVRLKHLLAEPMVTQRYGKFLSHNSAARIQEVKPFVVQASSAKMKKSKGKKSKPKKK